MRWLILLKNLRILNSLDWEKYESIMCVVCFVDAFAGLLILQFAETNLARLKSSYKKHHIPNPSTSNLPLLSSTFLFPSHICTTHLPLFHNILTLPLPKTLPSPIIHGNINN